MTRAFSKIWIIIICIVFVAGGIFAWQYWQMRGVQKCGIENCHGLDIKCGPNIPDACTEIYMLGDFCRQFASCEIINGECQLVKTAEFDECKACIDECSKLTGSEAFDCESNCRKMFEQIDETADWQTYRNEEYGYELKYPAEWTGGEESTTTKVASFTPKKMDGAGAGFWIYVYENLKGLTPKEWWEQEYEKGDAIYTHKGTFPISGINAEIYKKEGGLEFTHYVLSYNSSIYLVSSSLIEEEMHQILSTFRFIGTESIQIWEPICKTLESDQFNITVNFGWGLTNVAREALVQYIYWIPALKFQKQEILSSEEKIYAEDYIVKHFTQRIIFPGEVIQISCELVERAALRSRLLTITQKENLEQFSRNVKSFEVLELIRQIIEEQKATTPDFKIQIFPVGKP